MQKTKGFTLFDAFSLGGQLGDGYKVIEDGEYPCRVVWLNREKREVVTYCEGDVFTEVANDDDELREHIIELTKFYGELDITPDEIK